MSTTHVETPKEIAVATPSSCSDSKKSSEKKNNLYEVVMRGIMQSGPRDADELRMMLEEVFPDSSLVAELPFFGSNVPAPTRPPKILKVETLPLRNRFSVLKCERFPKELPEVLKECPCKSMRFVMLDPGEWECKCPSILPSPQMRDRRLRQMERWQKKKRALELEDTWREAQIFNEGLLLAREYDRKYGVTLCLASNGKAKVWDAVIHEQDELPEFVRHKLRSKRSKGPWFRRSLRMSRESAKRQKFSDALRDVIMRGVAQWGFDINIKTEDVKHEHIVSLPGVGDLIKNLKEFRKDLDWTVVVVEVVYFFLHLAQGGFTVSNLLLCASHFLFRIGRPGCATIFENIVKRMPWQAQSVEAVLGVLGMALAGCVSLMSVFLFSRLPADANIDKFINRFSRVGACFTSLEKLQNVSTMATNVVMNFIKSELLGMSSDDLKEFADIDKFCDEVMAVNTADLSARCQADTGVLRSQVNTWLLQADGIQKRLDALRVPHTMTGRFRSVSLFLFKVRDTLDATAPGLSQARIAPLLIHIHGQTGVGKSSMLDYLNTRLLVAMGSRDEKDLHNKVYYRNPGSEFWDGFNNGSEIVVCDDFGSVADSAVRPSPEPIEAIRMMNTCPYKPAKADLSGKANAQFTARVVIWTSNRNTFKFPSLTNPEAVANRVQLRFRHYPAPEFAKEKVIGTETTVTLDSAKVSEAAKTNPNAWRDCMRFDMEDTEGVPLVASGNYRVLKAGMTFEEFADECVAALDAKQHVGGAMRTERESYFEQCIRGVAQAPMEGSPFPEDLLDINSAELDRLADTVKLVLPKPTYFECPSLIGGWLGAHVHLNVFKFIADCGLHGDVTGFYPREDGHAFTEVQTNFMNTRCISYVRSDEPEILSLIYRTWRGIFRGEEEYVIQAYVTRIQTLSPLPFECKRHDDPEAVITFGELCRARLTELCKSGVLRHVRLSMAISRWSPIVSFLYTMLSGYIVYRALKWVIGWLFEKLWQSVTNVKSWFGWKTVDTEAYSTAGPRGQTVLKTEDAEAYSTAGPSGQAVRKTEVYANGPTSKPVVQTEAYPGGSVKTTPVVRTEDLSGEAESLSDQNAAEIRTKVAKNMYHIYTRDEDDDAWLPIGSLTFVRGRLAITNRHLHYVMRRQVRIVSNVAGMRQYEMLKTALNVGFADEQDSVYGQRDACLIEFPLNVHAHADILGFFMTSEDFSRHVEPKRVCLVKYTALGGKSTLMYQETDMARAFDSTPFDLQYGDGTVQRVRSFYCYKMETQGGDCGGVLIAFDPRFNRKICGVHMAGGNFGQSYTAAAVAVSAGFIEHVRSRMTVHVSSWFDGAVKVDNPLMAEANDGTVTFAASLPGLVLHGTSHSKVYAAKDSTISPSPVHEVCGPVLKKPAYLRDTYNASGVRVTPMATAMKKVSTPSVLIDQSALAAAKKQVTEMICDQDRGADARTLTFDEAVRGIPGDERYPAINRSTSPGYGWTKIGKGKTHWLGSDEFVIRPEVRTEYDRVLARLQKGERSGLFWTDTMKDELRPQEKVEAGKTRLFSAGEMVQTILLRQFFMGFNAHLARHAIAVESCVGVNPYSYDWSIIAKKLQVHGVNVVAGDFTNYDGTLPADGLWAVLDVVNAFYGGDGESNRIRALLWLEIVNSVHIQGDMVYSWTHSQPSGCPFTSILNSVLHSILVRVAFLLAARKYSPSQATLAEFNRTVSHVNYGDDDVSNISAEAEWFNQITMAEAYLTFGMVYTDETKTGELVKFRKLSEIQFLKRAFVFDDDQARYLAPLDINTIREMPCWNKTKGDQYLLTATVLEDAVYELAQHPREVFEREIHNFEIARGLVAQRFPLYLPSFEEVRYVDACRYTVPGAVPKKTLKLGDRGTGLMAETTSAANPAPVSAHPVRGYVQTEGGVFTPSGGCVPSYNNRLTALPTSTPTESLAQSSNRLSNNNNSNVTGGRPYLGLTNDERKQYRAYYLAQTDRPTMCADSFVYKSPEDRESYVCVDECPCDFHAGMDREMARVIYYRWCELVFGTDEADVLMGHAQAGEEETGTDANPNFAGGASHTETKEVMTFEHDGDVEDPDRPMNAPMVPAVSAPAEDRLVNELKDFLRRPIHIKDFVWALTMVPGAPVTSPLKLPYDWLSVNMIKEKLAGFRYMRCTLVIEVQINAQPMNQGAIMPFFNPVEEQLAFNPSSTGHFGGRMGYPHVLHRLGESTASRLRIPFFPLVSHFDLVKGFGTMGTVTFPVYSVLEGSDDCDGSVFIWAEDVDVSMPTGLPNLLSTRALTGVAQAGAMAERKRPGTVETAAKTAGKVAGFLGAVPGIGGVASVASTVLNGVGALASAFGWSKPIDPEYTQEVGLMFGRNMQNHNGDAKPKVMALDVQNTCNIPTAVFNTDDDEMAFTSFFRQPIHTDRFKYDGAQAQGSLIHKWPADPSACVKKSQTVEDQFVVFRQENNLSYLSSCARLWRGGIRFTYKFFKTDFHSGRLRFTYVPGATLDTDFATVDINKCYSQVHDLRATKDVEFVVPYNFLQPWKPTDDLESSTRTNAEWMQLCYEKPQGMVYVSVVNALRNPTTVAPRVDVCLWISADDDFQYAIPYASSKLRILSKASTVPPFPFSGKAQSSDMFETQKVREEVNASSVGEVYTGFRQWLKRYHLLGGDETWLSRERVFIVDRASTPAPYTLADDLVKVCGPFRRAAALYRFQCGSIRILNPESIPTAYTATSFPGQPIIGETDIDTGLATAVTTSFEKLMEFEVPFYQPFVALLTDVGYPSFGNDDDAGSPFTRLPYNTGTRLRMTPGPAPTAPLYRAIGETFSYGFRLGVPVTAVPTGNLPT